MKWRRAGVFIIGCSRSQIFFKIVVLKISQISQKGACVGVCEIFKNTFCYRAPPVATSVLLTLNLFFSSWLLYFSDCLNSRSSYTYYSPKLLTLLFLHLSYFLNSRRHTVLIANPEYLNYLQLFDHFNIPWPASKTSIFYFCSVIKGSSILVVVPQPYESGTLFLKKGP